MKLRDYIKELHILAKNCDPNIEVAYAVDEEGNRFDYVRYRPAVNTVEIDGEEVEVVTVN